MMLYHCIASVEPLKTGIIRCPGLAKEDTAKSQLTHRLQLQVYHNWRQNGGDTYNSEMLLREMNLCLFFHDKLEDAAKTIGIPFWQRIVLACDIRPTPPATELLTPRYGDKSLVSPEPSTWIVPTELRLEGTLKSIYVQQHMHAEAEQAMRATKPTPLEAELVLFEMSNDLKYPMYDAHVNGAGGRG